MMARLLNHWEACNEKVDENKLKVLS